MSGILAVYSLVIAVLIAGDMGPPTQTNYSLFRYAVAPLPSILLPHRKLKICCSGFMHLACGLSVGLTGLAAGYAIGIVGDMVPALCVGVTLLCSNHLSGRSFVYVTITDICCNGLDFDFRRSFRALRVTSHPILSRAV